MPNRVQNKRSSTENNRPDAGDLLAGEIAINTNAASANVHFEDASGNVRNVGADPLAEAAVALYVRQVDTAGVGTWVAPPEGATVTVSDAAPSDPSSGDLWWCSDDQNDGGGRLYVYYVETGPGGSSQWVDVSQPAGALSQSQADNLYLSKVNADTAAGEITFESGINVTGGDATSNIYSTGTGDSEVFHAGLRNGVAGFLSSADADVGPLAGGAYSQILGATTIQNTTGQPFSVVFYPNFTEADKTTSDNFHNVVEVGDSAGLPDSITSVNAFSAGPNLATGKGTQTQVRGFLSQINTVAGKDNYNFYAQGTAPNYFEGEIQCNGIFKALSEVRAGALTGSTPGAGNTDTGYRLFTTGGGAFSTKDTNPLLLNRTGTNGDILVFNKNGSPKGSIVIDDVTIGSPQLCDYRIKKDIEEMTGASEAVKALRPVTFEYTDRAPGVRVDGFIAHEVEEAIPATCRAVYGEKDATEAIGTYTDPDGVVKTEVPEPESIPFGATWEQTGTRDVYQGVDQNKLIPLLTKALQEVIAKNEDLEARLAALEGA